MFGKHLQTLACIVDGCECQRGRAYDGVGNVTLERLCLGPCPSTLCAPPSLYLCVYVCMCVCVCVY